MTLEQYEISWKDYYAALGLDPRAEPEVVRAAYTALARKYHPDAGGNSTRMKEINEAYEVLSDGARRAKYDSFYRKKQPATGPSGGANYSSGYCDKERPHSSQWEARHQTGECQSPEHGESSARYHPDGERILPWLPWKWQRIALFSSFPIAVILLCCVDHKIAWLVGSLLLVAAGYACFKTRCLTRTGRSNLLTKFAGSFAITLGLCSLMLAAATIAVGLVMLILAAVVVLMFLGALAHSGRKAQTTNRRKYA